MLPRGWAAVALLAASTSSATAQVATSDELGIERFRPGFDRAAILDVESGRTPGHLQWSGGALVGFAHDPLVVYTSDGRVAGTVVEGRVTTNLVGALGIGSRLVLGAGADIVGYQSGSDTTPAEMMLPGGGLGDLRLFGKANLVDTGVVQIAVLGTLVVPGGAGRGYLRESGVGFSPALALSANHGGLRAALNAGYHIKPRVDAIGVTSDDELFARLAAAANVSVAELWWSTSLATPARDAAANQIAVEMFGGASRTITQAVDAFVAAGIGLENGFGTPDWRVLAGVRFGSTPAQPPEPVRVVVAPRVVPPTPVDTDGDGLFDDDRCPAQAETKNGFRDEDGCPEAPAALDGRVVDPDGRAIARVEVVVVQTEVGASESQATTEATTDDDGRFTLPVLGGAITITARAPEYQDATTTVSVEPGQTGTPTITLVRKIRQGQLRGQVLSFDGKPLPATITVVGKTTQTVTADAEGNYTVELPGGSFSVEITAVGYKPQKRTVSVKLDGVTVLNVDLRGTK